MAIFWPICHVLPYETSCIKGRVTSKVEIEVIEDTVYFTIGRKIDQISIVPSNYTNKDYIDLQCGEKLHEINIKHELIINNI